MDLVCKIYIYIYIYIYIFITFFSGVNIVY